MTVTSRSAMGWVLAGGLVISSACGSNAEPADSGTAETVPQSQVTSIPTDIEPVAVDAADLRVVDVVAALGYPRDLLDRGRVNVKISRDGDAEFVILDKQLVADHFAPAPVETRRTVLPPDGRTVALQTLFGEVQDCDSTAPVTAALLVTYTYGDDPTLKSAAIPFTDASTLDQIRIQKCTVQLVLDDNEINLGVPVIDGETMHVDLVIRRRHGESRLDLDSIRGTVLFGASTPFGPDAPERILAPEETEAVIPLTIDVNRCDSHAVAETTRKFGIDLYVSVDGSESQLVQVPIDDIEPELEAMLDLCKQRTGQ